MGFEEAKDKLQGIYTIMITPMTPDFKVDLKRLHELTRFIVESGIKEGTGVLVPVGAGGEGYHLTFEELLEAVRTVIEAANGEIPVFPGCTFPNAFLARELCRRYQELGADGVQLSPPYYYQPSEEEYLLHYRLCAEAAPQLGIIAYNSWWNSQFDVTSDTLEKLAEIPNVIGVKWSSQSLENFQRAIRDFHERFSFIDNQMVWSGTLGFMLGMRGYVSSVPNFAPGYALELWELLQRKEWEEALRCMQKFLVPLYEFIGRMYQRGIHGEGSHWKACCKLVGRPMGPPRPPHRPYSNEELEGLREVFIQGGIL